MNERDMVIRDMMKRDVMKRHGFFGSNHDSRITTHAVVLLVIAALAGCGVDTATTAATGASIKKQEMEEGKRTEERAQQRIDQMQEQMQQRAQQAGGDR